MSDKTFTMAGTSIKNGAKANRFANCTAAERKKILEKDNHTEILLLDLPKPMTKDEALAWLATQDIATVVATQNTTPPASKTPKATTPTRFRAEKTSTPVSTFDASYTPTDLNISPVARAVHAAGQTEIVTTAEVEAEAQRLHKLSCVDFLTWTQLSVAARNEFRSMAVHCPKDKKAA